MFGCMISVYSESKTNQPIVILETRDMRADGGSVVQSSSISSSAAGAPEAVGLRRSGYSFSPSVNSPRLLFILAKAPLAG